MPLSVQSASQFVSGLQNAVISYTSKVKNFTTGSVAGAIINAVTAQLLFIQQQAVYIVSITRAATSSGADLTSFVADYLLNPTRLPAVSPYGTATFTKFQAATTQVVIPVNTIIQNAVLPPNTPTQYMVIAPTSSTDPNYANYNAGLGGYPIAASGTSVSVTVQAIATSTSTGTALNVQAGALSVIVTPGTPADTVSNASSIINGVNQETDAALRIRFQLYISGLTSANSSALGAAILGVQNGLTYCINDGLNAAGSTQSAYFTAVIDDGSGAIPAATLTACAAAIDATRAAGISRAVIAPTNVNITVLITGSTYYANFNSTTVKANIAAAITAWINANGVGGANVNNAYTPSLSLSYTGLLAVVAAFVGTGAAQGLIGYSSITLNGGVTNVTLSTYQLARASSVTVS